MRVAVQQLSRTTPSVLLQTSQRPHLAPRAVLSSVRSRALTIMASDASTPPKAARKPHTVLIGHREDANCGDNPMKPPRSLQDPYFWMRDDDRKDEDVLAYLKAENQYTEQQTAHLQALRDELYAEMKGHLKETDEEAPYRYGEWMYYTRTEEGKSYTIHCRRGLEQGSAEQVVLDENVTAAGHDYCDVGTVAPSPSHELLAYTVDTIGYETYRTVFVDLASGAEVEGEKGIMEMDALVWGKDQREVYYTKQDAAHRPFQLWRHRLGTDSATDDECLFTENDERFWVSIEKTRSGRFLVLSTDSSETSEVHLIDLQTPDTKLQCVAPRMFGTLYSVDHTGEWVVIATNADGAKNFKLVVTPLDALGTEHWRPLPTAAADVAPFVYEPERMVGSVHAFKDFIAVFGRQKGLTQLYILSLSGGKLADWHQVEWPEAAYAVNPSVNKVFDAAAVRLKYSSLVTPSMTSMYSVTDRKLTTLKETEVPMYDRSLYACERTEAKAADGTLVPVSLVYRRDLKQADAPQPLFLYAYGSYGACMEPSFGANRLPLLDRGMVYAIAHIRGGGEMGRSWYEDGGKYLTKRNTFTDFIDTAQSLVDGGWTTPEMLAIEGRGAGGLLMGAVLNMAPQLFKAAVAGVPFVDIMVTMADPSIPLTVGEWEEWGNPAEEKYFDYMLSYSPLNNVTAQDYPSILITAGLNDPRVAYWEPAKWTATLRAHKTDSNPLLLKVDMGAGHFSASDRYKYLKERAFELAFVCDQLALPPKA